MAVKSERIEARISPDQRLTLELGASTSGMSLSTFIIEATMTRAEELILDQVTTTVPSDHFDKLVDRLESPDPAPGLKRAAQRAGRGQINAR